MSFKMVATYLVMFVVATTAYVAFKISFAWPPMLSADIAIAVLATVVAITPVVEKFYERANIIRFAILGSALSTAFLYALPHIANRGGGELKFEYLTVDDLTFAFLLHTATIGVTCWWYATQVKQQALKNQPEEQGSETENNEAEK